MTPEAREALLRRVILLVGTILLVAAYSQRAFQNLARIDYRNSNFVFFWFAGRMVAAGENPYDEGQWLAQHELNRVTWKADPVFSYPLPLAVLLAPLGLLPLDVAYVGWQLLSLAVLSVSVWAVLRASGPPHPERLFFPLMLGLMFFGPVYLTLQLGALGALTLGAITGAVLALERRRALLAGVLLSLVLLKPSQGLPILILGGIWLMFRHNLRAIIGMAAGGLGLYVLGLLRDRAWPVVFLRTAQELMMRNSGLHSNVFSLAAHACPSNGACSWILGGAAALLVGGATLLFLWTRRHTFSHLEAFSLIIPIAFVIATYGWSYDQILYTIPIAWIAGRFAVSARGYLLALASTLVLVVCSVVALAVHAYTGTDLLSGVTSLLVLVGLAAVRAPSSSAASGRTAGHP